MNKKYVISVVCVLCCSAALAQPSSSELGNSSSFDYIDSNSDGLLDQGELKAGGQIYIFTDADKDRDGSVSPSEFDAAANRKKTRPTDIEIRGGLMNNT